MLSDPKREAEIELEIKVAKEPWRAVLRDAVAVLRERGWCRGRFESVDGRRCALGAIHAAALEGRKFTVEQALVYGEATARLRQHIIKPVAEWNDKSDAETVIATLEAVAHS